MRSFQGRGVCLLHPDVVPPSLTPWDPASTPYPPFRCVKVGTPEITVMRSAAELRQNILRQNSNQPRSCDHWNYLFTQATGVEAPDPSRGCFAANHRDDLVSFDQWFAWLEKQTRPRPHIPRLRH